jgi:hypothetical protein
VLWETAGPDRAQKVVWDVWRESLYVAEKLRWLPVSHLLVRKALPRVRWTAGGPALLLAGRKARAPTVLLLCLPPRRRAVGGAGTPRS